MKFLIVNMLSLLLCSQIFAADASAKKEIYKEFNGVIKVTTKGTKAYYRMEMTDGSTISFKRSTRIDKALKKFVDKKVSLKTSVRLISDKNFHAWNAKGVKEIKPEVPQTPEKKAQ